MLIMLVEDDPDLRDIIPELLEEQGYQTTAAVSGREALALLREMTPLPALVLLDWRMPIMNGAEFCQALQTDPRLASLPVLALSAAKPQDGEIERCHLVGWLRKPMHLEDLVAEIEKHAGPQGVKA